MGRRPVMVGATVACRPATPELCKGGWATGGPQKVPQRDL